MYETEKYFLSITTGLLLNEENIQLRDLPVLFANLKFSTI